MSMNTYPLDEKAALVITPELAAVINIACRTDEDDRPDPSELSHEQLLLTYGNINEAYEALEDMNVDGLVYCTEFDGSAYPLSDDGEADSSQEISFLDDFLCYIQPDNEPGLFSNKPYDSMDELVKEFREKLAKVVPEYFPLRNCICSVSGTYFC